MAQGVAATRDAIKAFLKPLSSISIWLSLLILPMPRGYGFLGLPGQFVERDHARSVVEFGDLGGRVAFIHQFGPRHEKDVPGLRVQLGQRG
jgi:hypothetical protein